MSHFFDTALNRVLKHEGGYVNHPKDPGGETNFGVTLRVARSHGYTGSMRDIPASVVAHIYKVGYWNVMQCDALPRAVAFQLFDAGVNHGPGNAIRWMQREVGVADDGRIGPLTRAAAAKVCVSDFVMGFNARRIEFYTRLSTFPTFGRGWANRVADNLRYGMLDN